MSVAHERIRTESDSSIKPRDSIVLTPKLNTSLLLAEELEDKPRSSFRSRSKSPHLQHGKRTISWTHGVDEFAKLWHADKQQLVIPPEHAEMWSKTRQSVVQAAVSVLGTTLDITHDVLEAGVELLDLAPVPGLRLAASILLEIWNATRQVDMNRLGCLRLTERCADILISVREELRESGDVIMQELAAPISKLEDSFHNVLAFMVKQETRPFLKRYLKRHEIIHGIALCDSELRDALGMFSLSIQIRILRQVQGTERNRRKEEDQALHAQTPDDLVLSGIDIHGFPTTPVTLLRTRPPQSWQSASTSSSAPVVETQHDIDVLQTLEELHHQQNSLDAISDMDALRGLMRSVLQNSSDVQMLEILQISRHEMPEAIKTLQRALEAVKDQNYPAVDMIRIPGSPLTPKHTPKRSTSVEALFEHANADVAENGLPPNNGANGAMGVKRARTAGVVTTNAKARPPSPREPRTRDTLDMEFIENGIDCLRRMSKDVQTNLPSWTITRYEVNHDQKIGIGFFSDVYRGTWRGRTVAIKVLAETTPRKLFIREMEIWKTLKHPNVLELYGASSTSGDPPWFFVSPYLSNGSLVEFLKHAEVKFSSRRRRSSRSVPIRPSEESNGIETSDSKHLIWEADLWRFMSDIATGMEYLHSHGVLHGDLKGSNVLVDARPRCLITDFGQSEMKSEASRISGSPIPHGTLRWQAPELMQGQNKRSPAMDIYAFSICCVEIMTQGHMPWPFVDDETVRHLVLINDSRPPIPNDSPMNTEALQNLLQRCWHHNPSVRPPFSEIVKDIKEIRKSRGQDTSTPNVKGLPELAVDFIPRSSPSMVPTSLPPNSTSRKVLSSSNSGRQSNLHTSDPSAQNLLITAQPILDPTDESPLSPPSTADDDGYTWFPPHDRPASPAPTDKRVADTRDERRYRLLLNHDYHASLTLPLWEPSQVELGAVGFLSRPEGSFVTLFNATEPHKSSNPAVENLPSVYGYGNVQVGLQQEKRNAAKRGIDAFMGLLTPRNKGRTSTMSKVARRYSFPLKASQKVAYLHADETTYCYLDSLDAPKKWFKLHVNRILQIYGQEHHLQKEDLFFVVGTLQTSNYALFVSHNHPNGHVHFNVFSSPKQGQPWGTFTTDTKQDGPSYNEPISNTQSSASKVSSHGVPKHAVLLARLRFKPDSFDPTSL